jgi:hypothetical protein
MFLEKEINGIYYYYKNAVEHLYGINLYISATEIGIAVAMVLYDEFMRPPSVIMLVLTC